MPDEATLAAAGVTGATVMAGPLNELVASLAEQAAAGTLRVVVADVLPLDRAAEGLATLASGQATGKIVVTLEPYSSAPSARRRCRPPSRR